MKRKVLVVALITVALASLLVACNSSTSYDGMTKIVYELEGGSYMNCDLPVLQYYDFKSGTSNLITTRPFFLKRPCKEKVTSLRGGSRPRPLMETT